MALPGSGVGSALEGDDRLRVQDEAVLGERGADPLGPGQARLHLLLAVGFRAEEARRSRPASLASYIAMSASTRSSSASIARPSPGRGRGRSRRSSAAAPCRPRRRCCRGSPRARRAPGGRVLLGGVRQDHGELVAAEPADGVRARSRWLSAWPTAEISSSPAEWPSESVDVLEVVEVEDEQRATGVVAAGARELALELGLEAAAVEEAGERVVVGEVLELALEALALGDVLELDEPVAGRPSAWRTSEVESATQRSVPARGDDPVLDLEARDLAGEEPPQPVGRDRRSSGWMNASMSISGAGRAGSRSARRGRRSPRAPGRCRSGRSRRSPCRRRSPRRRGGSVPRLRAARPRSASAR